MSQMAEYWGVFGAKIRRWASQLNLLSTLFFVSMLSCLILSTISVRMGTPGRSWWKADSWKQALVEAIPVFIFAAILRYEEKFRKLLFSKMNPHSWEVRMASLSKLIDELRASTQAKQKIAAIRTDILKCVVSGVAEVIDLPIESLSANLLCLDVDDKTKMIVMARSDSRRNLYAKYPCVEGFLPWRSLNKGSLFVEHNYREREDLGKRPYRSIVTVPITKGDKGFGSLSIDCNLAYAFYGRKKQVAYQVRPTIYFAFGLDFCG